MSYSEFDFRELTEFEKTIVKHFINDYPKEAKKQMNNVGGRFKSLAVARYRKQTKRSNRPNRSENHTLLGGVKKGRAYVYLGDEYQIRVKNLAPHAHLVEYGHEIVFRRKNGDYFHTMKDVKGKHIMGRAIVEFSEKKYPALMDKWVDRMLKKGFD